MTVKELIAQLHNYDDISEFEVFVITTIQFGDSVRMTALTEVKHVQENPDIGNKRVLIKGVVRV